MAANIIIIAAVGLVLFFAIRKIVKDHKRGGCVGCDGYGCSGAAGGMGTAESADACSSCGKVDCTHTHSK
ncbi:FeoB-associated Cys-rich membrane protein [Christensenellaceae bacterium OttesenSCG-928-K19]|nr:FeoB-associated Cys-rich membrane protein [Christensenellaceae bacterium OttesenSCG-928-K19]